MFRKFGYSQFINMISTFESLFSLLMHKVMHIIHRLGLGLFTELDDLRS
jgi:hypothetical protein